ncbi:MAG TPA: DUF4097 family beta strand repeat-containing protein [Gemmatimonadales bacterium]|nr:DUF4097 family beta strand repeat-containing protein [Gemmatimonadales bacterium]
MNLYPNRILEAVMYRLMLALACGITFPGPLLAVVQTESRQDVPFTWRERLAAGTWLRVYNAHGPVDAIGSEEAEAEVRGERAPGSRSWDVEPTYEVLREGNEIVLCVLTEYQTCTLDGIEQPRRSRSRREYRTPSVSVTVRVPRGLRLAVSSGNGPVNVSGTNSEVEARTGNGDLSVEGAGAEVVARSGNGDVRVTTARGPVNASTGNGRVWVRMEALPAPASMDFHTGNGTVTVFLPDSFEGDIQASTGNGDVDSDFPITTTGRFSRHRLAGRIGRGGPTLDLRTGNGDIELRKVAAGR